MSYFEFPHTRTYDNDLGWLIEKVKEVVETMDNFVIHNSIKYADPILWNITSQYEVNTVVINGSTGDAYISTKPVPSGIDIIDVEYWTVIFNYNNSINTIIGVIDSMRKQKVVLIGDSYGTADGAYPGTPTIVNTLPEVVKGYGYWNNDNFFYKYVNGSGFANGRFLENLQSLNLSSDITDIYVMGGWNDETDHNQSGHTQADVKNGIKTFAEYCKSNYPLTKIHLIFIASGVYNDVQTRTPGDGYYSTGLRDAWRTYKNAGEHGFVYHNDASYLLHNSALIQSEGIHPNQTGVYELAKAITSIIKGNICSYNYPILTSGNEFTPAAGLSGNISGLKLYEQVSEKGIKIDFYSDSNYTVLNFSQATSLSFGNTPIEVFNRMPKSSLGYLSFLNTKINAFVVTSASKRIDFVSDLFITPKKIYLVLPYWPDYEGGSYLPESKDIIAIGIGRAHIDVNDEIFAQ